MAAPTVFTNYQKVMRSVEYRLQQITNDNGYYTNGLVVDRGKDPTSFIKDFKEEWIQKMAAIAINPGDDKKETLVGATSYYKHAYHLFCMMELTDAQRNIGLRLDDLRSQLIWDVKTAFYGDVLLQQAAAALGFPVSNPNDGQRLSCIGGNRVVDVRAGEGIMFPRIQFIIDCEFKATESIGFTV